MEAQILIGRPWNAFSSYTPAATDSLTTFSSPIEEFQRTIFTFYVRDMVARCAMIRPTFQYEKFVKENKRTAGPKKLLLLYITSVSYESSGRRIAIAVNYDTTTTTTRNLGRG